MDTIEFPPPYRMTAAELAMKPQKTVREVLEDLIEMGATLVYHHRWTNGKPCLNVHPFALTTPEHRAIICRHFAEVLPALKRIKRLAELVTEV